MSSPVDAAVDVIAKATMALKVAFNPDDKIQPPIGGGSKTVRFFHSDQAPLYAFDTMAADGDTDECAEPFLWVRLGGRYRTKRFPDPTQEPDCEAPRVLMIEMGIARCAALGETLNWDEVEREAWVSLDDSYRLELALCRFKNTVVGPVSFDTIAPYGPEGGVVAWTARVNVQI
ncbi:hypothetical protein SEA_GLENHOPE_25 [Mycobacterium phage GlenHope]|nr:hypothetical protein SEA_GLENHOPE_25 [Mycobacterium phage GlenHope]